MKNFNIYLVEVLKESYGEWERSNVCRVDDRICRIDVRFVFRMKKYSKFWIG